MTSQEYSIVCSPDRCGSDRALSRSLFLFLLFLLVLAASARAEEDPRDKAQQLYREARSLAEDGKLELAIETAKGSIKADPEYAEAHETLGDALYKAGRIDEAMAAFNSAIGINPRHRAAKTGLGLALLKKGDARGAETVLLDAVQSNPYPSMAHYALGLVYQRTQDYEKAVQHFKEGIRTHKTGKR